MSKIKQFRRGSLMLCFVGLGAIAATAFIPNLRNFRDRSGAVATFNTAGKIDESNPFFQSLGTNGRTCATCHQADQAFSLNAKKVDELFERTHGADPLFAAVDGANCPNAKPGDRQARSLLLERGLIRVAVALPLTSQFTIVAIHDPYGCAITNDPNTGQEVVSVYRRPLPSTNLQFLSTVMFDGRETLMPLTDAKTFSDNMNTNLTHQATSAVMGHAQGAAPPTAEQLAAIVSFERGLSTAQSIDEDAGHLNRKGATGGPRAVYAQGYFPGINDSLGHDPSGAAFNPSAFTIYKAWENLRNKRDEDGDEDRDEDRDEQGHEGKNEARASIAAGEQLFNTAPAIITDVRGVNDNPALNSPATLIGTCTTCHDTPNVGNHSFPLPLDIGTSRQAALETNPTIIAGLGKLSAADMPVYEIRNCPDPLNPGQTLVYYTSDPGKALVTGQCIDVGRGKGPVLRGLAARAPYFHNGAAANLSELIDFYNERFQMNLTEQQKHDLIAFLNSL